MPAVSIVIPTFNQAIYLHDMLLSIYSQTFTDYEIIVVDDGSTDDTQSVLEPHYNRIRYIHQPNSGGCSQPRNRGIAAASGKYIANFDSDDLMLPMKLAHQYRFLEDNPTLDFVFTDFQDFEGSQFHSRHSLSCADFRSAQKTPLDSSRFVISSHVAYRTLITENYIGGSSPFFRKTLADQIGGFDESLEVSEDLDLWFRVSSNHDVGFIDEVCHYRRLHSGNMTRHIVKMCANVLKVYSKQLALTSDPSMRRALRSRIGEVYYTFGYYYRRRGDFRAALNAFRSGLRISPTNSRLYSGLLKTCALRLASKTSRRLRLSIEPRPQLETLPSPMSKENAVHSFSATQPMISVVIPTFNASEYLRFTLDSVLAQTEVSTEVIVVDDCSTDDTPELMHRYAEHVKYIRLEKNHGGPARPRNIGVQSATGECIALLDGDDVMLPGKLAEQYAFLACHTDIPFVFTNFRNFSDKSSHQEDFLSTHLLFHQMSKEHLGNEHYRIGRTNAFETLLGDNFIGTSGVVFRAPLVSAIGPFDETLKNSDDLDWWFRLTKVHDIGYINKVYHLRRVHPANISSRPAALDARIEVYTRRQRDVASKRARRNLNESLSDHYFGVGYQHRLAGGRLRPILSYTLSWYYSKRRIYIVRSMLAALFQLRPRPGREPYGL